MNILENNFKYLKKRQDGLVGTLQSIEAVGDIIEDQRNVPRCSILLMLGGGDIPPLPKECRHIILVEPNHFQLKKMLEKVDLEKKLQGREFVVACSSNPLQLNRFFYTYFRSEIRLAVVDGYQILLRQGLNEIDIKFFNHVKEIFVHAVGQVVTSFSGSKDHYISGLKHFVGNVQLEHIDYRSIKDAAKEMPAVIISGGPSLTKDIAAIKKFPGLIIALDAPYMGLLEEEIIPDFVVVMDREPKLIRFFEKYDIRSTLVAIPEINDKICKLFEPNIVMLPTLRRFYVKGLGFQDAFDGGTATTHLSFAFARYLGCDPVILCGQDFGMLKEDKTEARHQYNSLVKHTEFSIKHFEDLKMVEKNVDGKIFLTSIAFKEMKSVFEEMINDERTKCKVLNSSKGLPIVGTQAMELKDYMHSHKCGKPKFEYKYRKVTDITREFVLRRLQTYMKHINKALKYNRPKKYQKIAERFIKESLFNDIMFVMHSNDYIEYMNRKNKAMNILKFTEKEFKGNMREFFIKLQTNIGRLYEELS